MFAKIFTLEYTIWVLVSKYFDVYHILNKSVIVRISMLNEGSTHVLEITSISFRLRMS